MYASIVDSVAYIWPLCMVLHMHTVYKQIIAHYFSYLHILVLSACILIYLYTHMELVQPLQTVGKC